MEVATVSNNGSPFRNHDVREWSRLDSLTGVLERARLETDHWSAATANASHKYNKVVDSRARSGADGNLQQQARRKFEVFQSNVPGGRIQVIKTQTVSSSKWINKSNEDHFEDLQLSLNPLDLTSEKSKASVGRSVGRRPPSRSRMRDDILSRNLHTVAATNLHRVSRLCHQIHNDAVNRTFGKYNLPTLPINERESGDGVEIVEIEPETNNHTNLTRTKSTSSEDIPNPKKSLEDLEDLEQLQSWRRSSKLRRSLQYPRQKLNNNKPPDFPDSTGSVRKIREDLETGKRLNTALRGNSVDLDALDEILKSISNSSVSSNYSDQRFEEPERDEQIIAKKEKRNSFVTVESIQAVKDRLRRTNSPEKFYSHLTAKEDIDDGIVTEEPVNLKQLSEMSSKVKSYIYGMETKNISGTGSLESRSKPNSLLMNKNEDWFSRRKSYGFEQMHNQQESISSKQNTRVESSTDSGICRSTEIVLVPTPTKSNINSKYNNEYASESEEELKKLFSDDDNKSVNVKKYAKIFENKKEDPYSKTQNDFGLNKRGIEGTTITIPIISNENDEIKRHSIAVDESKYMSKTENLFKRTSLVINTDTNDDDDETIQNKKHNKKVEFCKTEVHFAADSGKVNIVETDEKPPPTQNFRRRRRNNVTTIENFNKSDLPVLHFGDTSYEKILFGDADNSEEYHSDTTYENIQNDEISYGNVTVNANGTNDIYNTEMEYTRDIENEAPKGILKNKPLKPKPYILGDNDDYLKTESDSEKPWGVMLKPTVKDDSPIWKSTVTVHNTFYDQNGHNNESENVQPEFKKLLKQLRPTTKKIEDNYESKRVSENFNNLRILSPPVDTRRSSWSVADRVKQVEDLKWTENRGYSTKVNFGAGEATVVENRHPTWPRKEDYSKDLKKNLLNKGLVVRIGRNGTNSKHTVCSKTTTNSNTNGSTTTTKITIDLTPSPTNETDFKFPRASLQSFKSPSLIMNTMKNDINSDMYRKVKMPPQLEALRKLYEEVHSDSEADKEVHQIFAKENRKDDSSSVVSGSWSKMRAFKHISGNQINGSYALIEKDNIDTTETSNSKFKYIDEQIENNLKYLNEDANIYKYSPPVITPKPLKTNGEKLSSPYLVGQNSASNEIRETKRTETESLVLKSASREQVLRQPKKSEMAYFGVKVSPPPNKTAERKILNKPDLLQFNVNNEKKVLKKEQIPLYENLQNKKFDSSILDELTKAADQILQAVNGYTDDEYHSKISSDDDKKTKVDVLETISETKLLKNRTTEKTKILKQTVTNGNKLRATSSNSSLESISRECRKYASAITEPKRPFMTKSAEQKQRKKVISESSKAAVTKARRLQRASSREALLQSHGSSSEDLTAQVEVVRKPRTIKKTKTTQLTVSNGLEMKKPTRRYDAAKNKTEERLTVASLPEIRHKTAVSTIRSTAEKAASREKSKLKSDDLKKRPTVKRDVAKGLSSSTLKSEKTRSSTNRESIHRHPSATIQKKVNRNDATLKH